MAKIAGVTLDKTKSGEIRKITLDLKKLDRELQEVVEDLLDHLVIEQRKNEPTLSFEDVVKRLDRKHGIRRKTK